MGRSVWDPQVDPCGVACGIRGAQRVGSAGGIRVAQRVGSLWQDPCGVVWDPCGIRGNMASGPSRVAGATAWWRRQEGIPLRPAGGSRLCRCSLKVQRHRRRPVRWHRRRPIRWHRRPPVTRGASSMCGVHLVDDSWQPSWAMRSLLLSIRDCLAAALRTPRLQPSAGVCGGASQPPRCQPHRCVQGRGEIVTVEFVTVQ